MKNKKLLIILLLSLPFTYSYAKGESKENSSIELLQSINDNWNNSIEIDNRVDNNWQTPEETYTKKKGQIEDLVIIKYFDLISKGVPKENLKIAVADLESGKNKKKHIFLICFDKQYNYVLDSVNSKVLDIKNRKDLKNIKAIMTHQGVFMKEKYSIAESLGWTTIRNKFNKHVMFLNEVNRKEKLK